VPLLELKVSFTQAGHLHQVTEQPRLECLITVDGNGQPDIAPGPAINVVAPLHAQQSPAMTLKGFNKLLA
jgi:hypothetical protein